MVPLTERIDFRVTSPTRPHLGRLRFQLTIGLALCVALPATIRIGGGEISAFSASTNNAILGSAIAYLVALLLDRQLATFPGIHGGSYILVSALIPFGTMAFIFLLFRFDYSRYVFFASFVHTICWLVLLHFVNRRSTIPDISIVPGGHADRLPEVGGARWRILREPPADCRKLQIIAADLRCDHEDSWERFLARCSLAGIPVYHSKKITESLTGKVQIEHLSENSFGSLLPNAYYIKIKLLLDWLLAVCLLPLFLVLFMVVAPIIVLTSGWPIFYTQERIGFRGERIRIYKFRTMRPADKNIYPAACRESAITRDCDSRITPFGAVLRKYRLDETPQIINVLKGEMSWIGPRPEAVTLSQWYEDELAFYSYRHVVRPGISGWAQVNQGHVTSPNAVLEKLHYDFFYIKYLSPWLDLVILLRTIRTIMFGIGAK
jgi:lipopolysaccharide/colanic/teichoic acid biosynthesis glycosyltransferase